MNEEREAVAIRAAALTAHAVAKYGPNAGSPKGEQQFDIFDYCANELAGVPRYVEMMINRIADMDISDALRCSMILILQGIALEAAQNAVALEEIRGALQVQGIDLGQPETL